MPILCNIYTGPWATKALRLAGVACNLALGKRISQSLAALPAAFTITNDAQLLLFKGTDIRDAGNASGYDVVEAPAGTGRFYWVLSVDDAGRGFANEHRVAFVQKAVAANNPVAFAGSFWPTPIP